MSLSSVIVWEVVYSFDVERFLSNSRYFGTVLFFPFRRRQWHPTPVLLPGKSHGWRSLVGCSPWGHEESDLTERLHFRFSLLCIGEGNGNPLQCSCLENPGMGLHRVRHDWSDLAVFFPFNYSDLHKYTSFIFGEIFFLLWNCTSLYFHTHNCKICLMASKTFLLIILYLF